MARHRPMDLNHMIHSRIGIIIVSSQQQQQLGVVRTADDDDRRYIYGKKAQQRAGT